MRRIIRSLATPLLLVAPLFAQELSTKPAPIPSDILGPQLIAWSQLQSPQPLQEASPQRAGKDSPAQLRDEAPQSPGAQTLAGTIVKDSGVYILKVSNTSYRLDNQDRVRKYEGKQVRVSGTLDAGSNSFHVVTIELIS